jgi:hypothetical protein
LRRLYARGFAAFLSAKEAAASYHPSPAVGGGTILTYINNKQKTLSKTKEK